MCTFFFFFFLSSENSEFLIKSTQFCIYVHFSSSTTTDRTNHNSQPLPKGRPRNVLGNNKNKNKSMTKVATTSKFFRLTAHSIRRPKRLSRSGTLYALLLLLGLFSYNFISIRPKQLLSLCMPITRLVFRSVARESLFLYVHSISSHSLLTSSGCTLMYAAFRVPHSSLTHASSMGSILLAGSTIYLYKHRSTNYIRVPLRLGIRCL